MDSNISDNNISKVILKKTINYDIIERREVELKKLKNNTDEIKKNSIKEFIYTNKNIPIIWKTKKNYQNLVLDILDDDNNFFKYLGNNPQKNDIINTNINRPKTTIFEKKFPNIESDKKEKQKLSFNKFINPKKTIRMLLSPQVEMETIFDDLKEKFPIKNISSL